MTYSIIAFCERTGRLGLGTATFSIACGRRNESVRPNVGISKSQAFYDRAVDPRVLNMLALGFSPRHVLGVLEAHDPDFSFRQLGIIDRTGHVVAHTGPSVGQWGGHRIGAGHAAFGNGLAGPHVVDAIVEGFMSEPGKALEWRLLSAIEAGRDAGGQATKGIRRPERSAWIRVVHRQDFPEVDARIDLHDSAVHALRSLMERAAHTEDEHLRFMTATAEGMPEPRQTTGQQ